LAAAFQSGTDEPDTLFPLIMFGWAITFLIVALVAALFGFGEVATFAVDIARIIFFLAIGLFLLSLVGGLIGGRMS
jgi:uncharacterized membrane protein YtjA (UPF0391 family)